jgi:hypothetical protein
MAVRFLLPSANPTRRVLQMMRLLVRSRRWNMVLAILGSIYAVSSIMLLGWSVLEVWSAEGITDRIMQIVLLVSALCSIWFVVNSLTNLGLRNQKSWHASR